MTADELCKKALEALGETYPGLGTEDPNRIAKAQAYALLAIAEELRLLNISANQAGAR
jgi:hypothetical protein